MASIKYTSIINAYVSTEGSNGFMTNYIYYSVLVVYDNGAREIVEGRNHDIARLLPFLRTPVDELSEVKATVKQLRQEINEITDQKVGYIIDSMFPIPDVQGMNEAEAVHLIKEAGLKPVYINSYPENTPKNGTVRSWNRNSKNFRNVDLDIIHTMPDVTGMKAEEARTLLEGAGFTVNMSYTMLSDQEGGIVLKCERKSETSIIAELNVSISVPDTRGMQLEEAQEALKKLGYDTSIERVASDSTPNLVQKWASLNDKVIKLWITQPTEIKPRSSNIRWTNLPDSAGDHYTVDAIYNNRLRSLKLNISYINCSKTKYKIASITHNANPEYRNTPLYETVPMDPGVRGTLSVNLNAANMDVNKPLSSVILTLEVQYGIMKKTAFVPLEITFEW